MILTDYKPKPIQYRNAKCPLCGSITYKKIFEQQRHGLAYSYAICKVCSHVYQIDRYEPWHYESLPYQTDWKNYNQHTLNRAQYIYDFCKEHINPYTDKAILDIGCSAGGVLDHLSDILGAYKAIGVTVPSDDVHRDKYTLNTSGSAAACDKQIRYKSYNEPTEGKYDFIVMCNVLEHFLDPWKALNNARTNLAKGGLLYIEVPSLEWVEMRTSPAFCPEHISYFTKHKLLDILHFEGFKVLKVKESKYWGNIKVLVKIKEERWDTWQSACQELFYIAKLYNDNWRTKLLSWKLKKKFLYWIYKAIKKRRLIKPND